MTPPTMDQLHRAILGALEAKTKTIIDEEAKNAAARVEERVRGSAGEIAAKVASWVDYSRNTQELRITVRLPERDGTLPQ